MDLDDKQSASASELKDTGHGARMSRWTFLTAMMLLGWLPLAATLTYFLVAENFIEDEWACLANGNIKFPWQNMDRFQRLFGQASYISIGTRDLSYLAARVLDAVWNILGGYGGQALLIVVLTPLFGAVLRYSMERTPASAGLYAALSLNGISWKAAYTATIDTLHNGRRSRQVVSLAIACLYVLAFPAMIQAIGGYQAVSSVFVRRPGTDVLVPSTEVRPMRCLLQDGSRIGLPDKYLVSPRSSVAEQKVFVDYHEKFVKPSLGKFWKASIHNITLWDGSFYDLGLTTLKLDCYDNWHATNTTISLPYSQDWTLFNSICVPHEVYQWGLAFTALLAFGILTALFSMLVIALWAEMYWYSRHHRSARHATMWSSIMDLASVLKENVARSPHDYTPEELSSIMGKADATMVTATNALPESRSAVRRKRTSSKEIEMGPEAMV